MSRAVETWNLDAAVVLLHRCAAVLCALRHAVNTAETDAQRCLSDSRAALRLELAAAASRGWPEEHDGRLKAARAQLVAQEQALYAAMDRRREELQRAMVASRTGRAAAARYAAA